MECKRYPHECDGMCICDKEIINAFMSNKNIFDLFDSCVCDFCKYMQSMEMLTLPTYVNNTANGENDRCDVFRLKMLLPTYKNI